MTPTAFSGRGCYFSFLGSAWHTAGVVVTSLAMSRSGERGCFERPSKSFVTRELFTCYV